MTAEPADGGYVAVAPYDLIETVYVYRRRDGWAEAKRLGDAHWFSRSVVGEPARTWEELLELGNLMYVGEVVNR